MMTRHRNFHAASALRWWHQLQTSHTRATKRDLPNWPNSSFLPRSGCLKRHPIHCRAPRSRAPFPSQRRHHGGVKATLRNPMSLLRNGRVATSQHMEPDPAHCIMLSCKSIRHLRMRHPQRVVRGSPRHTMAAPARFHNCVFPWCTSMPVWFWPTTDRVDVIEKRQEALILRQRP